MRAGAGKLLVCGTPIGNLGDASPRLREALAGADLVAAEDTRQARKLLSHFGLRARLVSYHEGNERQRAERLAGDVAGGATVALVTDAGMPVVSDPGYHLVRACLERELPVEVVPGPSAVLTALVASGLASDRFCFEGFLPRRAGARAARLGELATEPRTLVLFEAPHRLLATLDALVEAFGAGRPAAVCRELTKLHEEVRRGPLGELRDAARAGPPPRGEVTLVVAGAPPSPPPRLDLAAEVERRLGEGADRRQAMAEVARLAGVPRREVYSAVVAAKGKG